jgi:hypothetical protein
MNQQAAVYSRAVQASEAILARDGDRHAHAERTVAIEAILFGAGLDLGQVARGAMHGRADWRERPQPPRDQVSPQCRDFLRLQRLI